MSNFFKIIAYIVGLFLFSILLISFLSYISNGKPISFADSLGVFTLVAPMIVAIIVIITIDNWKLQENRTLEREFALKLSTTIDQQSTLFINLFSYLGVQAARQDTYKYFNYKTYYTITPELFRIIADVVTSISNNTHAQKYHSSHMKKLIGGVEFTTIYDDYYKASNDLYETMRWIFDYKAENIILKPESINIYINTYDSMHPKLIKFINCKEALDRALDKSIRIN